MQNQKHTGDNVGAKVVADFETDTNHIYLIAQNGTWREVHTVPDCTFRISGHNNNIFLYEPLGNLRLDVNISSNVNITVFPTHALGATIRVFRGESCDIPVNLNIGAGFSTTNQINIEFTKGDGGNVTIGKDCMFAWGIVIRNGDYHVIFDKDTGRVLNYNRDVVIGDHVWIASNVFIGKGVTIPDNSVVGAHSVVTRRFEEPNVVIAGVPARVVKTKINWDRRCIAEYEKSCKK